MILTTAAAARTSSGSSGACTVPNLFKATTIGQRPPSSWPSPRRRVPAWRAVAMALLCLAGCLTAVALTLAVTAVTHARIAERVRWSPDFPGRPVLFDEQAIVVIAAGFALIAAAKARSTRSVAICVAVGAPVAAAGALALSNAGAVAHCARHYNGRRPHRSRQLRPPRPDNPAANLSQKRIKRWPVLSRLINE